MQTSRGEVFNVKVEKFSVLAVPSNLSSLDARLKLNRAYQRPCIVNFLPPPVKSCAIGIQPRKAWWLWSSWNAMALGAPQSCDRISCPTANRPLAILEPGLSGLQVSNQKSFSEALG